MIYLYGILSIFKMPFFIPNQTASMRKSILFGTIIFCCTQVFAQDNGIKDIQNQSSRNGTDDTSKKSNKVWKKGGNFSLNVGQGGSRNWASGAEKFSLSIATYANLYANRRIGKWSWDNTLDLGYALVNTSSQGVRKNDDKIDLFSKLGRDITKTISVSLVANFRSQFNDGFDYNYLGKGYQRRTSGFMAPAYITFAPGFDWHPTSNFSIFLAPAAARAIVVTKEPKSYLFQAGIIPNGGGFELPLSTFYGVDPARQVRMEVGGFMSINYKKEILKNINYKTRLDLFSNYQQSSRFVATGPDKLQITNLGPNPQNVDVFWTNTFNMTVNKWMQVTYNFDLIYDDDVRQFGPTKSSPAAQLRSLLAIGVSAKF